MLHTTYVKYVPTIGDDLGHLSEQEGLLGVIAHRYQPIADAQVVRILGKRLNTALLFKMEKQHLKLVKEIKCRDFDMLIAITTIVFIRYIFIAYRFRMESDQRSFGDLFYAFFQKLDDFSFFEALHRIMILSVGQLRQILAFFERTAMTFFDTVIAASLKTVNLSKINMITVNY